MYIFVFVFYKRILSDRGEARFLGKIKGKDIFTLNFVLILKGFLKIKYDVRYVLKERNIKEQKGLIECFGITQIF